MEHEKSFAELTAKELYGILQLRQRVFVVEQACAYLDCDDYDQRALHLWTTNGDHVIAYARVFAPGEKCAEASIGRVISAPEARRTGAGRAIVARAIATLARSYGRVPIRIAAQSYLLKFYRELGFEPASAEYLEDSIPHHDMVRRDAVGLGG